MQKILDLSNHKPSEIFVDKDSELYNRSMKSWLQGYDIEMYSAHNKGKLVVGERFIWNLSNEIYSHMTSISKKCVFWWIDDIANK